jgi:putative transposase
LSTQLAWMKKKVVTCLKRDERVELIERAKEELSLSMQAQLLGVNRTSLYYQPVSPSEAEVALKHRVDRLYTDHPSYGSRRITEQLRREGVQVNRKAVMRHMHEMGLAAIYPGPNLSKRAQQAAVYPYLLRGVEARFPNHVWE